MGNGYYMLRCSTANKSSQSAVAMASYRSGDALYSDRDGLTKSYQDRFIKPESFIIKPDHAPEWTLEREKLWNEVERAEPKDNARIAREVLVSLPNEMNEEQQTELTREFVKENFSDEGMVADVSIHRDDVNNPHAHIMLTTRPFDEHGEFEKRKSKRVPALDQEGNQKYNEKGWRITKSIKTTNWDDKTMLKAWRKNWAEKLNEKTQEFGLDKTYSELSFSDQGRLEKAQIHLTREEYQFERKLKKDAEVKGKQYNPQTYYAQKNEEIKKYNERFSDVIHLEDYRTKKDYKKELDQLRNAMHIDKNKIDATRLLVNRVKGYVDYQSASKLHHDFNNNQNKWKLKIERANAVNESKRKVFNKLQEHYQSGNQSIVEKYGYSKENFPNEVNKDLQEVEKAQQKLNDEENKFQELKQATITSLDYQKELLDMEFSAVYDETDSDRFNYEEKYFAMQMLKDYQIRLPEDKIQEEMKSQDKYNDYQSIYTPTWKQAKDLKTSIDIYDRTLKKLNKQNINNLSADDLKDTVFKIDSTKKMKANYEQYIQEIEPLIDEDINQTFHNEALNASSLDTKIATLEAYSKLSNEDQEQLDVEQFIGDLQQAQSEQATYLHQKGEEDQEHQDMYEKQASKSEEIAGGLFNAIKEAGQDKDLTDSRNRRDRTKTFRKRGADGREL